MPATIVQDWVSADTGAATAANVTVNLGATATAGNTLLVAVNSDATVSTPSGYTVLQSSIHNAGCYLFGKVAAGSETGVTVAPSSAAATCVAIVEIGNLSGAAITNRLDQTATNGSGSGATSRSTGTTGTTTQADEYAVAVWGYSAGQGIYAGGGANKWSGQTNGFVEKVDAGTTKVAGTNVGLCVAVEDLAATGTVESSASTGADAPPSESLVATFKVAAGGGASVAPGGVSVAVALGSPLLAWSGTIAPDGISAPVALGLPIVGVAPVAPGGIAVPVALGSPTLTWSGAVGPDGISVPVVLGAPIVGAASIDPDGIAVPVTLGAPALAWSATVAPDGISAPVVLGAPIIGAASLAPDGIAVPVAVGFLSLAWSGSVSPDGISVPVALGAPSLSVPGAVVARPNIGTVARRAAGLVIRPDTGVVSRP